MKVIIAVLTAILLPVGTAAIALGAYGWKGLEFAIFTTGIALFSLGILFKAKEKPS